ncbi:MAG: BatA and WFA domain-containing protein [Steroidobacteraceae bacterium]
MSWLAPLFLGGLAVIALPIWLHRLQTETPKRQAFSSAMLLLQAERRVHVQKRLRYWLLLALRILLLGLLAFAFAKPMWTQPPEALSGAQAKLHVLLLDSSMSMQQGERWSAAMKQAEQIIADAGANDRLELVAAGDELQLVAGPVSGTAEGKDKMRSALQKLQAGASQLQYGAMMNGLEALLADETQATVAHVISDFQESALPAQFGDLVPRSVNGRVTEVELHNITQGIQPNWTVSSAIRTGNGIEVTVQGYNSPQQNLTVQLTVNGSVRAELSKQVPASGVAVYAFDKVALNTGSNKIEARIKSADTLAADDVFYTVLENSVGQPVPFLSMNPTALPGKYLDAAFTAAGSRYELQPAKLEQFDARTLDRYRFIVLDDLGALVSMQGGDKFATALNEYVQKGGAVLAAVGERSQTLKTLPLVQLSVGTLRADEQGERLSVGNVDINHAALSRAAGFRALNVTRYLPVNLDAQSRALVQLDNGAPLLIEQRRGQGRVLLLTSGLDNTWNDLPVQPVFVSFLTEAARYLAGETLLKREQRVGASLPLDQAAAAGQVIDPAGNNLLSLSDSQRARSVKLATQGFYEVVTAAGSSLVAVNAVPDESNLMPMSDDEIKNWQDSLTAQRQDVATAAAATAAAKPSGFELWHLLLVLLTLAVLAESLLGNTYVFRRVETPT